MTPDQKTYLQTLKYRISESLLFDCVDYLGLHKLVDFKLLDSRIKPIMMSLFTRYKSGGEYLRLIPLIEDSAEIDSLGELKKIYPSIYTKLIDVVKFKVNHLAVVYQTLAGGLTPEQYRKFHDAIPYDTPYPFIQSYDSGFDSLGGYSL